MAAPVVCKRKSLLELGSSAVLLELCDESVRVRLGNVFFDNAHRFHRFLRVGKAETRRFADNFDDGDLVGADLDENDVEFRLLVRRGSSLRRAGSACGGYGSGRAYAEFGFKGFYELVELENGHRFYFFDEFLYIHDNF